MQHACLGAVRDQGFEAVDRLQHQKVGNLRRRPAGGGGGTAPERVAAMVQQPVKLPQKRVEPRRRSRVKDRGDELVVEHHAIVGAPLDNVRQRQARIRIGDFTGQEKARLEIADLDDRGVVRRRCRVAGLQLADVMTDEPVRSRRALRLERRGPAQRHGEEDDLIAHLRADRQWRRQRIVVRHPHRRAVRKHAHRAAQREFADRQKVLLELDLNEPPAVRRESLTPAFDVALEVPILLLEMLRLEEQPFGPDNFVVRRHVL